LAAQQGQQLSARLDIFALSFQQLLIKLYALSVSTVLQAQVHQRYAMQVNTVRRQASRQARALVRVPLASAQRQAVRLQRRIHAMRVRTVLLMRHLLSALCALQVRTVLLALALQLHALQASTGQQLVSRRLHVLVLVLLVTTV